VNLLRRIFEKICFHRHRSAQAEHARFAVILFQPGRIQPMMRSSRAEVPQVGVRVTGKQRVAANLVPAPLPDDTARQVADVVVIKTEQGAEIGLLQRLLRPRNAVPVQAPKVDPLLEIDVGSSGCGDRPVPVPVGLNILRTDDDRVS
jgi:hypothetical protein